MPFPPDSWRFLVVRLVHLGRPPPLAHRGVVRPCLPAVVRTDLPLRLYQFRRRQLHLREPMGPQWLYRSGHTLGLNHHRLLLLAAAHVALAHVGLPAIRFASRMASPDEPRFPH